MSTTTAWTEITTIDELVDLLGVPNDRAESLGSLRLIDAGNDDDLETQGPST